MNKSRVAVVACRTYDDDAVLEAVRQGIRLLGGAKQFLSSGERLC